MKNSETLFTKGAVKKDFVLNAISKQVGLTNAEIAMLSHFIDIIIKFDKGEYKIHIKNVKSCLGKFC